MASWWSYEVGVGSVLTELVGSPIPDICVTRLEGSHVVQFDLVLTNAGDHGMSFLEGGEKLGLSSTVPADENGKIGEVLGCEGSYGLIRLL